MYVFGRCLGISSSWSLYNLYSTFYCPFLIKGSHPRAHLMACNAKFHSYLNCQRLLNSMWHCGTQPIPPGSGCQKRGRMHKGRPTVTTFDEVHLYNLHVPGIESPNYNHLWISEVSRTQCTVILHSLQCAEYWIFFCSPHFQCSIIICQLLSTQILL